MSWCKQSLPSLTNLGMWPLQQPGIIISSDTTTLTMAIERTEGEAVAAAAVGLGMLFRKG